MRLVANSACEFAAGEELFELQVMRRRMVPVVAARHARQPLAFERPDGPAKCGGGDQPVETRMRGRDVGANHVKLRIGRHVQAAADPDPCGRDLEIQAAAFPFGHSAHRKVRRRMRLERRLIRAEARVAVDAIQRHLRLGHEFGRERFEVAGESLDQRDHRLADIGLVLRLASAKPFAIVVAFQRPQEPERFDGEGAGHEVIVAGSWSCSW